MRRYPPGEKVIYSCKLGFLRFGKETRYCEFNGKWSDSTPFCDAPSRLKNPVAFSVSNMHSTPNMAIDGNLATCFTSRRGTGEYLKVYLMQPEVINAVRLYLPKGRVKINVAIGKDGVQKICNTFDRDLAEQQWVLLECKEALTADCISIQETSGNAKILEVCELEAYVQEGLWCKDPPDVFIPNGWLQISRERATLQCDEGYKPENSIHLVCDKHESYTGGILQCTEIQCGDTVSNLTKNGEWKSTGSRTSIDTVKKLKCDKGYEITGEPDSVRCLVNGRWSKTTATCKGSKTEAKFRNIVIIASVIVVVIIIILFGIILYLMFKKKAKPVVVVLKPDDGGYAVQSCSSRGGSPYSEAEYSTIAYEALTLPQQPSVVDNYSKPADQWSRGDGGSAYTLPHSSFRDGNKLPAEIAFASLKSSALYGT